MGAGALNLLTALRVGNLAGFDLASPEMSEGLAELSAAMAEVDGTFAERLLAESGRVNPGTVADFFQGLSHEQTELMVRVIERSKGGATSAFSAREAAMARAVAAIRGPNTSPEETRIEDEAIRVGEDEIKRRMKPPEDKPVLVGWMRNRGGKVQPVYSDNPKFKSVRRGPYVNNWNPLREIREIPLEIAAVEIKNFQKSGDYQYLPKDLQELLERGKLLVTAKEKDRKSPYSILIPCVVARNEQEKNAGRAGILLKDGIPVVLVINGKEFLLEIKGVGNPDGGYDYEYEDYPRGAMTDTDSLSEFDVLERKRGLTHNNGKGDIIRAAGNIVFKMDGAPIQQGYVLRLTPGTVRASFNFLFEGKDGSEVTGKIALAVGRQLAEFIHQGLMPKTHLENFVAINDGEGVILTDYTDIFPMHYLTLEGLKDLVVYGLFHIIFDMLYYEESLHKGIFLRAIGEELRELGSITSDEERQFVGFTEEKDVADFIWGKIAAVEYYRAKRRYGWVPDALIDFYELALTGYFEPEFPGTVFDNADEAIDLTNSGGYREAYKKYLRMSLQMRIVGSFPSDKWDEVKSYFEILRKWGGSNSGLLSLLEPLQDEIKLLETVIDRASGSEMEETRRNIEIARQRMAQLMEMNPHDFWRKMHEEPAFGVEMAMLPYFSNVKDDPVLAVRNEWRYYKSVLQPADGTVLGGK